jgi:RecB family endonuclease NucS
LEIKAAKAQDKDVEQLEKYVEELGEGCIAGILIARDFPRKIVHDKHTLKLVTYNLSNFSPDEVYTFEQLLGKIRLATISRLNIPS